MFSWFCNESVQKSMVFNQKMSPKPMSIAILMSESGKLNPFQTFSEAASLPISTSGFFWGWLYIISKTLSRAFFDILIRKICFPFFCKMFSQNPMNIRHYTMMMSSFQGFWEYTLQKIMKFIYFEAKYQKKPATKFWKLYKVNLRKNRLSISETTRPH